MTNFKILLVSPLTNKLNKIFDKCSFYICLRVMTLTCQKLYFNTISFENFFPAPLLLIAFTEQKGVSKFIFLTLGKTDVDPFHTLLTPLTLRLKLKTPNKKNAAHGPFSFPGSAGFLPMKPARTHKPNIFCFQVAAVGFLQPHFPSHSA